MITLCALVALSAWIVVSAARTYTGCVRIAEMRRERRLTR